jgi:hypothetical protein
LIRAGDFAGPISSFSSLSLNQFAARLFSRNFCQSTGDRNVGEIRVSHKFGAVGERAAQRFG